MDFISHTFTQEDIDNLISSQAEENVYREFKRGEALKKEDKAKAEIAKDVSAFANSDGGIIIYGIEEKDNKATDKSFINGNEITKEWLEDIITSRVQRKIEGLQIDVIRYDNKIEHTIYVVKIPRSLNAPHIASDKKYYKRYNFKSTPMEEYEVRDLYTRQEKTHLKIVAPKYILDASALQGGKPSYFVFSSQINIENLGQTIEKLYKVEVHIPRLVALHSDIYLQDVMRFFVRDEGSYRMFSIPNGSPLFQNELASIATFKLKITANNLHDLRHPLIIKLLYTNGTEERQFPLLEELRFNGNPIVYDTFRISHL